jgi:hypothetical protein
MEAHGAPSANTTQSLAGLLPDALAKPFMQEAGIDRLTAVYTAIDAAGPFH